MTITLPWQGTGNYTVEGRLRRTERHLAEVRADNAWLLAVKAATDDYFTRLVADRDDVYDAYKQMAKRAADSEIVASCAQSELETVTADRERLETEVRALRAQIANLTAVTVPAWHRDIDPGDHPTEPTGIDVRDLRTRFATGPVVSLHYSPQAVSPTHVPALAALDTDTVALPVLADQLAQGVS
ncbi:hypothetical protein DT019_03290 [Streptomyces sp. SDr-06]|uniref:hypothetical protein n=1 Tax=Streptomyces sp. SDr-06 TaxID=2267702 RepID=UPI000DEAF6DB|nr:hypothetical protein [Streptomyces sp. SDr-06]RCH70528.1 hypothetical protein DT019_03290 [Streptomyces sp. SDr-06]